MTFQRGSLGSRRLLGGDSMSEDRKIEGEKGLTGERIDSEIPRRKCQWRQRVHVSSTQGVLFAEYSLAEERAPGSLCSGLWDAYKMGVSLQFAVSDWRNTERSDISIHYLDWW